MDSAKPITRIRFEVLGDTKIPVQSDNVSAQGNKQPRIRSGAHPPSGTFSARRDVSPPLGEWSTQNGGEEEVEDDGRRPARRD